MSLLAEYGGEVAALSAAFLWAIASLAYRRVGEQIPAWELNLVKGVLAAAMLALTLWASGDSLAGVETRGLSLLLASGALGIGLGDTAFFEALQELGPRRTLLLGTLAPPLAALLALVTLGEMLTPGGWAGIGVTVAGVAWVVTERLSEAGGAQGRTLRGLGFGLVATLAQASGSVLSHAALTQTTVSPLWGAFLRLAAGVVVLVAWMALARRPAGRWLRAGQAERLWGRLLFAVFAGTYLGVWLQQVALKLTAAGIAQTLLATSPLFVLPLAAWTGERVSTRAVAGAVVALVGIGMLFGLG
jgi:drug/metabolite transporter (DMT)-like permease